MAIKKETYLKAADNSGAIDLQCIHIYGSTGKDTACVGDVIKCAVKKAIPGGKVKKSDVVVAVIVRTVRPFRRADGTYIRFGENAAVIIKDIDDETPIATRIFGPVVRELRLKGYSKIISLAPEVL
jgi:large subunit ribosomal protein L14